ncbi:MAG TPA: porin [Gammaproteobacteria bacterium]|nr:porin [Gammaproteobacteria bacterium]
MRKIQWASLILAGAALFTLQAHADTPPGTTTVGGVSYLDLTDLNQDTNGTTTNNQGYGVDVKRFYLVVDHTFDDVWSANLTTDFNYLTTDKETQLFVKKAFVQAKVNKMAIFRLGSADMPWIPFDEGVYGYRFVENTLIDRLHFGNSADWGVHFLGQSDGNVANYAVSVVNGGGYKNPTRTKGMDWEGRIAFMPVDGLVIAVGGYTGDLGANTQTTPSINTATRLDALVAYKTSAFAVGGEYFHADNFGSSYITTTTTNSASGYSIWGNVTIADNGTALFARYDNADPSKDLDPSQKDKYYNFGISFPTASKNITWAFVYKHEDLADNTTDTTTKEIGVWAQVKF